MRQTCGKMWELFKQKKQTGFFLHCFVKVRLSHRLAQTRGVWWHLPSTVFLETIRTLSDSPRRLSLSQSVPPFLTVWVQIYTATNASKSTKIHQEMGCGSLMKVLPQIRMRTHQKSRQLELLCTVLLRTYPNSLFLFQEKTGTLNLKLRNAPCREEPW